MILHISKTNQNLTGGVSTYEDNCIKLQSKNTLQDDYIKVWSFVTYHLPLPPVVLKFIRK